MALKKYSSKKKDLIKNMEEVWFLYKFLETILGLTCMIIHIQGFEDDRQPLPHEMYFCGTYFGFTMNAIFGIISIILGSKLSMVIEVITSACATVFFVFCSILSMHHAENDYHLMYLSDYEESIHPFFSISKKQSICSLICGLLYLLHAIFAFDALTITDETFDINAPELAKIPQIDIECHQPIKLYIFGEWVHHRLEQEKWFQKIMGKEAQEKVIKIIRDVKFVRET